RGVVAAVPPELAEVVAEHRDSRGAILVERRESGGGNAWRRHGFPARLSGEGRHRQQGHDDACDDWVAHGPESITHAGFGRLCGVDQAVPAAATLKAADPTQTVVPMRSPDRRRPEKTPALSCVRRATRRPEVIVQIRTTPR